jgi:hypothetical protein
MQVHVLRLFDAIKTITWRHGFFTPEKVKHEVRADGSHLISIAIEAADAECEPPKRYAGGRSFGRTVGATPDGPGEKKR